jgi:hypothetical protein
LLIASALLITQMKDPAYGLPPAAVEASSS